jgi:hypothetical protein
MSTDLKAKLTGAQWRHHRNLTLKLEGGEELEVAIRRPPPMVLMAVLDAAQRAGEVDEKKEPTSEWNSLRLLARLTIACLFAPDAVRPLFTQAEVDDVLQAPWLLELQDDVQSAMAPAQKLVESAQGNSEATQT